MLQSLFWQCILESQGKRGGESIAKTDQEIAEMIRANNRKQQAKLKKTHRSFMVRLDRQKDKTLIDWIDGQYNANFAIKKALKIASDQEK